jgi:VanZ family protein
VLFLALFFQADFRLPIRRRPPQSVPTMADDKSMQQREISKMQRIWPFVIAGLIFVASSRSHVAAPGIIHVDKIAHFSVYGLLATLLCRLGGNWRAGAWAILLTSLYGITDEWHQSYVPGRSTEVADWVADTSGATLAVALYWGWLRYRQLLETVLWPRRRRMAVSDPVERDPANRA